MINTSNMHPDDFVSTIPAEACTEFGFENDDAPKRWGMNTAEQIGETLADIGVMFAVAACLYAVFG